MTPEGREIRRLRPAALAWPAAFLIGAFPVLLFWFHHGGPLEPDVHFHLAIARDYKTSPFRYDALISEGALSRFNADREPLFHLALAAFLGAGLPPFAAAAALAALNAGLVGLALYGASRSFIVVLCGVFATNTFLFRLAMCRPQGLAIACVLFGVTWLRRGHYRRAALVNLVYTAAYSVPVLLLGAAILEAASRRRWSGLL
jgi:hypothetical protein